MDRGINVRIGADNRLLVTAIDDSNQRLRGLGDTAVSTSERMKSIGGAAASIGKSVAAAGVAIAAFQVATSKAVRETAILAAQAGLTSKNFSALAFATRQYGVEAENIADISKDLKDKLGEFVTAGTGAFNDFVEAVGLSEDASMKLAEELQNLSGDEALGKMVQMLEEAGVSGAQMTFVMEAMGNDASKLIPLFANNSKELERLKTRYNEATGAMSLSVGQMDALKTSAEAFDVMNTALAAAAKTISATLAPVFEGFFNYATENVPKVTQYIKDFINSFKDIDDVHDIKFLEGALKDAEEGLAKTDATMAHLTAQFQAGNMSQQAYARRMQDSKMDSIAYSTTIEQLTNKISGLKEGMEKLDEQAESTNKTLTVITTSGSVSSTGATGGDDMGDSREEEMKRRQAHADEAEAAWLERQQEHKEAVEEVWQTARFPGSPAWNSEMAEARQQDAEDEQKMHDRKLKATGQYLKGLGSLMSSSNRKLFELGKAAKISEAVLNAYSAISQTFADPTLLTWEKFAAAAVVGGAAFAQVSNLASASFGGSGSAASPVVTAPISSGDGGGGAGGGQGISLSIEGEGFSQAQVVGLIEQINDAQKDGAVIA